MDDILFDQLMNSLKFDEPEDDAPVAETLQAFWRRFREILVRAPKTRASHVAALAEDALLQRLYVLHFETQFGQGALWDGPGSMGRFNRSHVHPAVTAIAKAREGLGKAMKEIYAQLEEEAEESGLGLADMFQPMLEKAGDVLKDEIECQSRTEAPAPQETSRGGDRTHPGAALEDRLRAERPEGSLQSSVGGA